jgi:hypothetical protein
MMEFTDYYKIISISARVSVWHFSRCRKYVINSLIHGHFHIGLVIIPRPILALDFVSGLYGCLGIINRPIWKCPCINLYILYITLYNNLIWIRHSLHASIASMHRHVHVQIVVLGSFLHYSWLFFFVLQFGLPS